MKSRVIIICVAVLLLFLISTTAKAVGVYVVLTITPTVSPTPLITATPTQVVAPLPTSVVPTVTYEQLLGVHQSVLKVTEWSVSTVLATVTALLSIISILGVITGGIAYTRISDAAKRADAAKISVDTLGPQIEKALLDVQSFNTVSKQIQAEHKRNQEDLKAFKSGIKSDYEQIHNTLLLVQLEERSIELYSDEPETQRRAINTLKAMVTPERPAFVRRHAALLLGTYALDYQEQKDEIIAWLNKVMQEDSAASVRRTAEHQLKKFNQHPAD